MGGARVFQSSNQILCSKEVRLSDKLPAEHEVKISPHMAVETLQLINAAVTVLSFGSRYFSEGPPPLDVPAPPTSSATSTHLLSQLLCICDQLHISAPAPHPAVLWLLTRCRPSRFLARFRVEFPGVLTCLLQLMTSASTIRPW